MEGLITLITLALCIAVLVAWIMAIAMLVKMAKEKGHYRDGAGMLWFVGLFASPIVLGLYVAALSDKSSGKDGGNRQAPTQHELPII